MAFMICSKLLTVTIKDLIYLTQIFIPIYTTICYTIQKKISDKFWHFMWPSDYSNTILLHV